MIGTSATGASIEADAIGRYHDLLDGDIAAATRAQLDQQSRDRKLMFGDRPVCTVLRPRFMSTARYRFLQRSGAVVMNAFAKAYRAAMDDASLRAQFGLEGWEEQLIHGDPGFREPSPVSRLDAFFVGDEGLRFTEYNAETPAGPGYNDVLSEVFMGLPAMRGFLRSHEVRPLPARHNVLHALLDAHLQWGRSGGSAPRIAILDWKEVPTYSEFVIFRDYFERQGISCSIVDPRDCEFREGKLSANGQWFDLIYKRVLISELVTRGGLDHPVIEAVRQNAVCMVNPFRCKILHKKTSLAVLSDERNASLFSPDERAAIAQHVPWTRRVEERTTQFAGARIDLLPFIQAQREQFVLKPNDEYGGKGIVLGWEASADEWSVAMAAAMREPYIVQARVELPVEAYPLWAGAAVEVAPLMLDTAPYVSYGSHIDGCLTRLSSSTLLNVTAGGGSTVPTFLIEPR